MGLQVGKFDNKQSARKNEGSVPSDSGSAKDGSSSRRPEERRHGAYGWELPSLFFCDKNGEDQKEIPYSFIESLKLEESIDNLCVFGEILIRDPGRFRKAMAFENGREYIFIDLKSNNWAEGQEEYKGIFSIVNITEERYGRLGASGSYVLLSLAQYPAYRNSIVWKVSKGYKDVRISDIIEDLFDNYLNKDNEYQENLYDKSDRIEETKYILKDWCIPFWSPYKVIDYLMPFSGNESDKAGYHCFFDLSRKFNFRSLQHLMQNGDTHELKVQQGLVTGQARGEIDETFVITDYFPSIGKREYDKTGLAGSTIERFNFYKKKNYTHKRGYLNREYPEINNLYEKPEDINNIWGYHTSVMWPWYDSKHLINLYVNNNISKSSAVQCSSSILIHGSVGDNKVKPGDKINVRVVPEVTMQENSEELEGQWFVRGINHSFTDGRTPYRQILSLSRKGEFDHEGEMT